MPGLRNKTIMCLVEFWHAGIVCKYVSPKDGERDDLKPLFIVEFELCPHLCIFPFFFADWLVHVNVHFGLCLVFWSSIISWYCRCLWSAHTSYNKSSYCMPCILSRHMHWQCLTFCYTTFLPFRNVAAFATLASVWWACIQLSGASVHAGWQTRKDCSLPNTAENVASLKMLFVCRVWWKLQFLRSLTLHWDSVIS